MCGIVGIAQGPGAALSVEDVRGMADTIRHRGPDDEGFHVSEGVILGMRRLSIIDLAGGHQPMSDIGGNLSIVFNGEI